MFYNVFLKYIFQFICVVLVLIILIFIGRVILTKIEKSDKYYLNPQEYLPDEEIKTLKQVFYLIIMSLIFVDFIYSFIYFEGDLFYFAIFDIILSLYLVIRYDKNNIKRKIIAFFLLPLGSMTFIIFNISLIIIVDCIHVPVLVYFIYLYYKKFKEYTENNSLGFTIILLYAIIFFSLFFTLGVENQNPLNALVMVSNAFTSNGYTVLGKSVVGKLNSIVLVWSGYIISSAATATLTASILLRYFNKRLKRLEDLISSEGDEK